MVQDRVRAEGEEAGGGLPLLEARRRQKGGLDRAATGAIPAMPRGSPGGGQEVVGDARGHPGEGNPGARGGGEAAAASKQPTVALADMRVAWWRERV